MKISLRYFALAIDKGRIQKESLSSQNNEFKVFKTEMR